MSRTDQSGAGPALEWRSAGDAELPVSTRFDDPYFSLANGLAETRHVFLAGNELPSRLIPGFAVAELGFGTGLNMLATLIAWQGAGAPAPLHYTSFEAFPMQSADIARALRAFPEALAAAGPFLEAWDRFGADAALRRFEPAPGFIAEVMTGDARHALPAWQGAADAWYLDGFSPAKNPELWELPLMQAVYDHTRPGGTFATYTAAGFVRRALQAAGFQVFRQQGHGTKRHMTVGRRS